MFCIQELLVTGQNRTTSKVTFCDGLNIICGPSNTGKTYIVSCIDYVFGNKNLPFSPTIGYDTIILKLKTESGSVVLTRKLETNQVEINSNDPKIESGTCSLSGTKKLNSVLLKLIGIDPVPMIISSQAFKTQNLSWRNILHTALITEERVIRKPSILMPEQKTAETSTLSALTYLATGKDFGELLPKDSLYIAKVKREAVAAYIWSEIRAINQRQDQLKEEMFEIDLACVNAEIDRITQELALVQDRISSSLRDNQALLAEISAINEQLAKCTVMRKRYHNLKSQYTADLGRLNFIADTAINAPGSQEKNCPFCNSIVEIKDSKDYILSAKAEYQRISLQLADLEGTINSIDSEIMSLEKQLAEAMLKYKNTEDIINKELKPCSENLKDRLQRYQTAVRIQSEIDTLTSQAERMSAKVSEVVNEEESEVLFKVREHIPEKMIEYQNQYWPQMLKQCEFDGFRNAVFDKQTMDVIVNGQSKASFGKGYRAYLNTLNALGTVLYLRSHGKYCLPFLIVDSPILSLKEKMKSSEAVSSPMRTSLFREFMRYQVLLQIIIVENEIPVMDYEDVQLIEFTKSKTEGRYGFLEDVTD